MTAAAGGKIYASDINTRVGAATPVVADGPTTTGTTEYTTAPQISATATLVAGRKYKVVLQMSVRASVAGDCYLIRIREDSTTGTQLQQQQIYCDTTSVSGFPCLMIAEYTAVSSGSKTFAVTMSRNDGTGVGNLAAAASRPATLTIDLLNEA